MMRNNWLIRLSILAIGISCLALPAHGQSPSTGSPAGGSVGTSYRFSYTSLYQFETDLDAGGKFDVQRHLLRFNMSRVVNRNWMVGLGLSFDYDHWDFGEIQGLAGVDLWDDIYRPGISLPIFYTTANRWRLAVIPSMDLAGASGADAQESISYGAIFSAARSLRPGLMLGLGVGLFERLDQGEIFPYLVIDWQITDQWKLSNPFQAGPVGPAGLELSYTGNDLWELGVGGAYRSYRFRLGDSSTVADGIGEVEFWAPFIRLGRRLGPKISLDLNAGALLSGQITIEDQDSDELGDTGYDPAPFVGVTLKGRF